MTETDVLKIIVGVLCAGFFSINVKMVWQWLSKGNENQKHIEKIEKELIVLQELIDDIHNISDIIKGNGQRESINNSILYRLSSIEEKIERLIKPKPYQGF